jgi:hypothetical protein
VREEEEEEEEKGGDSGGETRERERARLQHDRRPTILFRLPSWAGPDPSRRRCRVRSGVMETESCAFDERPTPNCTRVCWVGHLARQAAGGTATPFGGWPEAGGGRRSLCDTRQRDSGLQRREHSSVDLSRS